MAVTCRRTRYLMATAFALSVVVATVVASPASALLCAREWGDDTFAGAKQAVADPARWDGLVVGTIAAVEHQDDYWQTRVLVVKSGVVFSGDVPDTVHAEIGGHGPDMSFVEGGTYFLALTWDAATASWFVHPCGPNMPLTRLDQLTQLQAISDSEVVLSELVIPESGMPAVVSVGAALAAVALAGAWLLGRSRALSPAVD